MNYIEETYLRPECDILKLTGDYYIKETEKNSIKYRLLHVPVSDRKCSVMYFSALKYNNKAYDYPFAFSVIRTFCTFKCIMARCWWRLS